MHDVGCNPSLFSHFELSRLLAQLLQKHTDTGYLVNITPPTVFAGCFLRHCRCFCLKVWRCA